MRGTIGSWPWAGVAMAALGGVALVILLRRALDRALARIGGAG